MIIAESGSRENEKIEQPVTTGSELMECALLSIEREERRVRNGENDRERGDSHEEVTIMISEDIKEKIWVDYNDRKLGIPSVSRSISNQRCQ